MKKKHFPKNNKQTCRIRSLLLNINDGFEITHEEYKISQREFESYFTALENAGYIKQIKCTEKFKSSSYIIFDIDKFNKFKNNAYKIIEKFILPLVIILLNNSLPLP